MPTTTLRDDVAAFAAAVRAHLDDLPADEVEDLTDGLESDLLEQAEDNGGRLAEEDAAQYAAELRASAGLPDRPAGSAAPLRNRFADVVAHARTRMSELARSSRFGVWLTDLLLALRPVWWVFRGWAVYVVGWMLVAGQSRLLPDGLPGWVLLVAVVLVSIQWGRGRWLPMGWLKGVRLLISIVAVVSAPFLATAALNAVANAYSVSQVSSEPAPVGLTQDGQPVTNIFGYDAEGKPLEHVQLFDQDGEPLLTVGRSETGSDSDYTGDPNSVRIPFAKAGHDYVWNVFPLREAPLSESGQVETGKAQAVPLPFQVTSPLSAYRQPAAGSAATAGPTPSPTAGPTGAPTPAATAPSTPLPTPTPAP
ncbi:hypothetical protein KNO15_21310 [Leifsonia shinshuensis]|uniref:hypothetical protein n=1 Tax=Leifsonia shinshuensis TaxID=150026 RepID=UPI001F512B90|nr:hypothetical protein [Leifsonia shinshuensis]MCI0159249.1 hypothetical protein [Leifsonia shinshuensis]